jgi:hypothetical protein
MQGEKYILLNSVNLETRLRVGQPENWVWITERGKQISSPSQHPDRFSVPGSPRAVLDPGEKIFFRVSSKGAVILSQRTQSGAKVVAELLGYGQLGGGGTDSVLRKMTVCRKCRQ